MLTGVDLPYLDSYAAKDSELALNVFKIRLMNPKKGGEGRSIGQKELA
jgi:hypothetical protein